MDIMAQWTLLLGALISFLTAKPFARMLDHVGGPEAVDVLIVGVTLSLPFYVLVPAYLVVTSEDARVSEFKIITTIISVILVIVGVAQMRDVKARAEAAEKTEK